MQLAIKYKERGVVGVDLSGDPMANNSTDFTDALLFARLNGLKV